MVLLRPSEKLTKHAWPLAGLMGYSWNWCGLPWVPYGTISSPSCSPSKDLLDILVLFLFLFPLPLGYLSSPFLTIPPFSEVSAP